MAKNKPEIIDQLRELIEQYESEKRPKKSVPSIKRLSILDDVLALMRTRYERQQVELLYVIAVSSKNQVMGIELISKGSTNCAHVNIADIFRPILLLGSVRFILTHNHPSGDATPSAEDRALTDKIKKASELMGLDFLDHIVVADIPDMWGISIIHR
jgi:DNA repair protein RadC